MAIQKTQETSKTSCYKMKHEHRKFFFQTVY